MAPPRLEKQQRDYMHARDDRTNFKFSIFLELLIDRAVDLLSGEVTN